MHAKTMEKKKIAYYVTINYTVLVYIKYIKIYPLDGVRAHGPIVPNHVSGVPPALHI